MKFISHTYCLLKEHEELIYYFIIILKIIKMIICFVKKDYICIYTTLNSFYDLKNNIEIYTDVFYYIMLKSYSIIHKRKKIVKI